MEDTGVSEKNSGINTAKGCCHRQQRELIYCLSGDCVKKVSLRNKSVQDYLMSRPETSSPDLNRFMGRACFRSSYKRRRGGRGFQYVKLSCLAGFV